MVWVHRYLLEFARRAPWLAEKVAAACLRLIWGRGEQPIPRQLETRLPAAAYKPHVSHRVYEALRRRAKDALEAGCSVIIDAVSLKPAERQSFAAIAAAAEVPFSAVWLTAPAAMMDRRLQARHNDASDASPKVLAHQLQQDPGPLDWVRVDSSGGAADCLAAARWALGLG